MEVANDFLDATVELMEHSSRALTEHRFEAYPQEAVGILCSDGTNYPLINQARSDSRFEVSETLVREAIDALSRLGREPVAVYHSHPTSSSSPSNQDISMMKRMPGALSIIVGIDGIAAWRFDNGLQSVGRVPLPEKVSHGKPD